MEREKIRNMVVEAITDTDKLTEVVDKLCVMTEKNIIKNMQNMCEESLSPDVFEKWEEVKKRLKQNRQALKG